ncbi:MAG TPA: tRNA dihydrouridine synthase DusB [Spirochaetota bacterium]|nr:tRNA dihydrouridine synthase DusB [Spirochaetota bacterium]
MYLKPLKIGNLTLKNNIFIAPLAGYTNLPTRLIYRNLGAGLAYSEMISAEGLNYSYNKSVKLLNSIDEDKPLGIQLFGANAERILMAFKKIKDFDFDLVDINCGCSVKKIVKSNAGACLLKTPDEIYKIIKTLKENTDKPVTLKIRSGYDMENQNFIEVLEASESAGASLITLHPRTKTMLFSGKANWEHIKILKEKSKIPVIGNGDIFTAEDAKKMFETTNCDGIMLARGVINNPFLIKEIISTLNNETYIPPSLEERVGMILEHCRVFANFFGEAKGVIEFRKYFHSYIKGFHDIKHLREKINSVLTINDVEKELNNYLSSIHFLHNPSIEKPL